MHRQAGMINVKVVLVSAWLHKKKKYCQGCAFFKTCIFFLKRVEISLSITVIISKMSRDISM